MKKFFRILLWVAIAAIFVGTFVYLFVNSRQKPDTFEIVTPEIGEVSRTTVLTGKIEPRDEVEVKPQVSGIIAEINVEPGDLVHEGDIIAKIKIIPDEGQLASAENRVKIARLDVENAKAKYERTKSLYEKKFESRETFEVDENAYLKSKEELASAIDALSIVKEGFSASTAQSSNTLVRATTTGLVLEVPVKVGSSVIQANTMNDGTTVAKIADMTDLIFKGKIDETEVGMLREGMAVDITVGALPDSTLSALIEKIAPLATEENGTNTFEIKAAIAIPEGIELRAGYSANARVLLETASDALVIPERVLTFEGDSTFVHTLVEGSDPQQWTRVPIATGISDGVNIVVKSSLSSDSITTSSKLRGAKLQN